MRRSDRTALSDNPLGIPNPPIALCEVRSVSIRFLLCGPVAGFVSKHLALHTSEMTHKSFVHQGGKTRYGTPSASSKPRLVTIFDRPSLARGMQRFTFGLIGEAQVRPVLRLGDRPVSHVKESSLEDSLAR